MQLRSDAQLGSWQKQVSRTSENLIMNALEGQALDGHKSPLSILLFPELDFCHAIGHEFLQSFRYPAKATEASAICPCSLEILCCCINECANHQSEQDHKVLHSRAHMSGTNVAQQTQEQHCFYIFRSKRGLKMKWDSGKM